MFIGQQAIRQILSFFQAVSVQPDCRRALSGLLLTGQLDPPVAVYLNNFESDRLAVFHVDTNVRFHRLEDVVRAGTGKEKDRTHSLYRRTKIRDKKEKSPIEPAVYR
jgi:hypothetical protein